MINKKQLQDKLRNAFFGMIANLSHYSQDEILSETGLQFRKLLPITHVAFYVFNEWNKAYELVPAKAAIEAGLKLRLFEKDSISQKQHHDPKLSYMEGDAAFINPRAGRNLLFPLQPRHGPSALMLFMFADECLLADELLHTVKEETEKFLKIVNYYHKKVDNTKKSKFLFDLTSRFYSTIDKKIILKEIVNAVKSLFPDFNFYILLSQDYEEDSVLPVKMIEYSDDETKRASTLAFLTGEIQIEENNLEESTFLYAPLKGGQGVYGVLQIIAPQIASFPKKEIEFISQFAHAAGKAIENAALFQDSNHLVSDLKLINNATHKLNLNLKLSEITSIIRKQIMHASGATQVGFIYLNGGSGQKFDILSGSTNFYSLDNGKRFATDIMDRIMKNGEPIFSGDMQHEYSYLPYRSVMAIPMIHSGSMQGITLIMHEAPYYFSFETFKLIQSLIQHSTLALTNSILKDKLEQAVITDYLTQLYSRNYLDEKIGMHMKLDKRGTLVLFDIDDFKKVNDTFGHHVGDKVILQVAAIISENLGKGDVAARWGGEELAVYLPNAHLDDGVALAGKIGKLVENKTDPNVTLSSGVSMWNDQSSDSVVDVFIRADKALYEAKSTGKNCVMTDRNKFAHIDLPDQ